MARQTQRRYAIPGMDGGEPLSGIDELSRRYRKNVRPGLEENRLKRFKSWEREAYRRLD